MDNMNQQMPGQQPQGFDPRQVMQQQLNATFRTPAALKYSIMVIVGFLPMFLVWMFLRDGTVRIDRMLDISLITVEVSYGAMWGIGLGVWVGSIITAWIIVKYLKDFKVDIVSPIVSTSFMILLLYVTPQWATWGRFLLAIPLSMMMMGISNLISMVIFFAMQGKTMMNGIKDLKGQFQMPGAQDIEQSLKNLDDQLRQEGFDVDSFNKELEDEIGDGPIIEVDTEIEIKDPTRKIVVKDKEEPKKAKDKKDEK